jgi:hypothetical protein
VLVAREVELRELLPVERPEVDEPVVLLVGVLRDPVCAHDAAGNAASNAATNATRALMVRSPTGNRANPICLETALRRMSLPQYESFHYTNTVQAEWVCRLETKSAEFSAMLTASLNTSTESPCEPLSVWELRDVGRFAKKLPYFVVFWTAGRDLPNLPHRVTVGSKLVKCLGVNKIGPRLRGGAKALGKAGIHR